MLLAGCAKIVTPIGGPKDTTPPAITKEVPQNGCNNFSGNSIKITFNEFVTLNNTFENVLISPPLPHQPTFSLSGKTLVIKFTDTLQSNQTYNIGFANCIQDFTEGNPIPFYNFAFSTGEAVDSFMLQGTVTDAKTTKKTSGCFVFAYSKDIDSLPLTTRPQYITKTQPNGSFTIKNIKSGNYKLFALKDINNNLIFDLPNEEIAFAEKTAEAIPMPKEAPKDSTVTPDTLKETETVTPSQTDQKGTELLLFMEEDPTQDFVKLQNKQTGKYEFLYKSKIINHKARILSDKKYDYFEIVGHDTLTWYLKETLTDSLVVEMTVNDTVCDTLRLTPFRKSGSRQGLRRGKTEEHQKLSVSHKNAGELYKPLVLNFSYPIRPADSIPVQIITTKKYTGNDTSYFFISIPNTFTTQYVIDKTFEEKVPHTLLIRDSVFYGYDGETNDTIRIKFTTKTEKDYGLLRMTYQLPEGDYPFIVQLLNGKEEVLQSNTITNSGTITYANLAAGSYKLKAIEDRNGNGVWDTGNYRRKLEPERVFFFSKPITIRGYWELEENWEIVPE